MTLLFRKEALVAAMLLAALCCGGCVTEMGIEASGKKGWDQEGAPQLNKNVILNDSSLTRDIQITDLKSGMAGNIMRAQVSLRSKQEDPLTVQYKFDWYDANGIEIAANNAWNPLIIYGGESKTIQGVAPDPRAHEFKLKLRHPD